MAVDDVYTLQLGWTAAAQKCMNLLAFRRKVGADPTQADALALANDWKEALRVQQHLTVTWTSWVLQQVRGGTASWPAGLCKRDGGTRLEGTFTGTLTGTGSGDMLPPQSAFVTTLGTGFSGRRRRGRMYLGGVAEARQAGGLFSGTDVSSLATTWATQMAKFGPSGTDPSWQIGIWSARTAHGCVPSNTKPFHLVPLDSPDPAAAFLNITTTTVRDVVYTQRRRTIGVGR